MLNQPSLDELIKKADSRYALVVASAKQARILTEQNQQGMIGPGAKSVTQALDEIMIDKIKFRLPKREPM